MECHSTTNSNVWNVKKPFLMISAALTIIFVGFYATICDSLPSDTPHIIFILADDLGWNDVGFHGSGEIPTPNIDALAYAGVILNNYYVNPICTPSRSALMTGRYPIHTGMQHRVLYGAEPRGLPLTEKLLPQYLKDLGYVNRIVGKWHLGHYKLEYTPLYRGFDSHLGLWTGHHDYYDHIAMETGYWGFDMRRNVTMAHDLFGKYSTDVFTDEAVKLIDAHDKDKPLFMYIAHAAVHSANPYNPLPSPDEILDGFEYIKDRKRRNFAGMLSRLDKSVGDVVEALRKNGMLQNSVIVFSSDNGGPASNFNLNAASNWPLRGVKDTYWEGGLRASAFVWSPLLGKSRVSRQMMHITDWLPTLLGISKGNVTYPNPIDGFNLWEALVNEENSPRIEILHNIDDIFNVSALLVDQWKIVQGTRYNGKWDNVYGPAGREYSYDVTKVIQSVAAKALQSIGVQLTVKTIQDMRTQATIVCDDVDEFDTCQPLINPCLFDIQKDPCERNNVASRFPEILQRLRQRLMQLNETQVPPGNLPIDPRGNPALWANEWTNFGDRL